ncbi:MAG: hypothetical protein JXO22_10985 [Phycisphaerae bacterium]|nr:hypothetical protein [Phycisphaerae bacterium]
MQLPPDLVPPAAEEPSTLLSVLSGVGIGAITAAAISGFVLFVIERIRQNGENKRKQMDLTRQDQRQWNQEIRDAFAKSRDQLRILRGVVGNTRLAAHWSNNEDEMVENYQSALAIKERLAATADSLRAIADNDVVEKFNAATALTEGFIKQFSVKEGRVTYTKETVNSTKVPDYEGVEEALLSAVKAALKTPTDWAERRR